jgi:NSS family neurotransmitter:Na+ symporter
VERWYELLIRYAIPAQVVVLITWWFSQVIQADPTHWWNPLAAESVGTCLFQWALAILVFVAVNRMIVERTLTERVIKT